MARVQITVVEDVFAISGRGTIAVGVWQDDSQRLHVGDCVEVRRPDGASFETVLTGVDLFTKCFGTSRNIGLLLGAVDKPEAVPKGSEVWLLGGNREDNSREARV
jgi:translation elongation factor EF-Tu-like GTPase